MKFEIKKKVIKPLCIYSLAFSMLLPSVASLADLDINLGGYSVVQAAGIEAPTVTKAFIGTNTISGGNVHRGKIDNKTVRGTIHVTLKNGDTVKAELSVTPKSGTTWTVNLPDGVTIAEGDTVTAYQEFDGQNSPATTANAEKGKNLINEDKLKMPSGEIWIEQTNSNIVNDDEKAEARDLFDAVNKEIAGDIKSVKFSIDGTDHAYYEVTYTDGSTSGKVEATDLKIKQVTETSRGAKLNDITIVDNVIKGKLKGEGPFTDIKVQIVVKLSDADKDSFCNEKGCTVDKTSSNPVDATVDGTTGEFSYTIDPNNPIEKIELGNVVGVTVKEPHKFVSCSTTTVKPVKVEKQKVKDPRKLTAKDKEAIDAAIRSAYTVNGESKLPNGTGDWKGVPAVIQIDDSGNVKIFSGNDVKGDWDWNNGGIFVPEKNEDGSVKLNDGAEAKITIQAKDLLKNIKPDAPKVDLSGDKKSITITPNEKDTDANSISVSYTGKDGKTKTTTATKDKNGTWSITEGEGSVDKNGVVTLPKDKVKGDTTVTATVTDKGGIADDDTTPLTSDPGTFTVKETIADKVEALGGLDPVALKKWVKDTVDWKEGVKAKDSTKETEVNKLLAGATFTDVTETNRSTSKEGDFEGKIKITFDDKSELVVEKQMLYVSNHVTSVGRKDKVPTDALDVEFKLGEGTKVDNTGSGAIEGNKENPTSYSNYKVKPNTNLKEYKIPAINTSVVDSIKVTPQEGYIDPVWRDSKNGTDFVATTENNVFTATATKTFKVTVVPNGGTGDDKVETKKSGEKYTLPNADTFTPSANQKFAGWLVGDATTTTEPGKEITITGDTVIKASWKPIMVDVIFDKGEG
ncbi:repeat protein, partial [Peptoniphilus harei]